MYKIEVKSNKRQDFIDVTKEVSEIIKRDGMTSGIAIVFVTHTTAGITINENADSDVLDDLGSTLNSVFPNRSDYSHVEGNSDAHVKSMLTSASLTCIVENNKLVLGVWQAIYLCDFDGPRTRQIFVKLVSDK